MTPGSSVLAHSPLTGPAAWGKLPTLLREEAHEVVVINVQDDDEPPFAERYLMRSTVQIGAAELCLLRSWSLTAARARCSRGS